MTSQPITTTATKAATAAKQASNTDAGDMQNSQPFGEVLARQIRDPDAKNIKASDKLAADSLAQLATDTNTNADKIDVADDKKTDVVATDSTTGLPTDMLAALIPQGMNTSATGTDTSKKSDRTETATNSVPGRRDATLAKTDAVATAALTDAAQKTSNSAKPGSAQAKEHSFSATLTESANRPAPAMELKTTMREAITLAAQKSEPVPQANTAALASLQNTSANLAAPAVQTVLATINTPVDQRKWSDEFSQKITWLASSKQDQTAELHLNPAKLGPLDVVIKVNGDHATVQFTSSHAAVREAVEQAMPRLREMLADNGIMLGNTTVSDQAPRDQGQSGTHRTSNSGNTIQDAAEASNNPARVSPISRHNGIVDTFA